MEKNIHIHNVNPIPLVIVDLDEKDCLQEHEIQCLQQVEWRPMNNNQCIKVSNTYNLLQDNNLHRIKDVFDHYINYYTKEVLSIKENFKMIGSWITRQNIGGNHHSHNHPNSLLSILWYFNHDLIDGPMSNLNLKLDGVKNVFKDSTFTFSSNELNKYNYTSFYVEPTNNKVFIFPSRIEHNTEYSMSPIPRYCIGANYFVADILGSVGEYSYINIDLK